MYPTLCQPGWQLWSIVSYVLVAASKIIFYENGLRVYEQKSPCSCSRAQKIEFTSEQYCILIFLSSHMISLINENTILLWRTIYLLGSGTALGNVLSIQAQTILSQGDLTFQLVLGKLCIDLILLYKSGLIILKDVKYWPVSGGMPCPLWKNLLSLIFC